MEPRRKAEEFWEKLFGGSHHRMGREELLMSPEELLRKLEEVGRRLEERLKGRPYLGGR